MQFTIKKKLVGTDGAGRAGSIGTAHGVIETPAFVTVGTKATVKALTPAHLNEIGAQVVLGNTYHLYLEPGEKVIAKAGGLGKFMGWSGPTMTDSGGFQVFSLGDAFNRQVSKIQQGIKSGEVQPRRMFTPGSEVREGALVRIDEEGVTFKSYKDGSKHRFTPERSIEIQHAIGADIIFAFDECTSPTASYEYQKEAMARTHRWAARSLRRHRELQVESLKLKVETKEKAPMLFGITQGGRFEDLRRESAKIIGQMDFDGFGIGGSFDKEDMHTAVQWVTELLPEEKPRHLLGIGDPLDLFDAVENGCDLFDCVAPTRQARTGSLYTKHGRFNIENSRYKTDFSPVEDDCKCYTCSHFTKAYVAHLFRSGEILANTLASIHNVHFIVRLVKEMREGILNGTFGELKKEFIASYRS